MIISKGSLYSDDTLARLLLAPVAGAAVEHAQFRATAFVYVASSFEFCLTILRLLQALQHLPQNRDPCLFCFCLYLLPAKCVIVSGTRRLRMVLVSGARKRYQQLAPEN